MIINNEYNNNFYHKSNFHEFVINNNQDIFDIGGKSFFITYIKYISVDLV